MTLQELTPESGRKKNPKAIGLMQAMFLSITMWITLKIIQPGGLSLDLGLAGLLASQAQAQGCAQAQTRAQAPYVRA